MKWGPKSKRAPKIKPRIRQAIGAFKKRDIVVLSFSLTLCWHGSARADDAQTALPRTSFGYVGLIEMPSARMAPDGDLATSVGYFLHNQRYDLSFQITPWLQASFLYSGQSDFFRSQYGPIEWDRSFYLKARLWDESGALPAVAVGLNDFVGTGLFSGEYLVASKKIGDFDTAVGLGWGALATANHFKNPFSVAMKSFNTRTSSITNQGQFDLSGYFHGPTGLFGGIDWRTPIEGLTLIAEYSSNDYGYEKAGGSFAPKSQFNFGATYDLTDEIQIGLQWMYGRSLGANFSYALDPTTEPFPARIGPQIPPVHVRTEEEQRQSLARSLNKNSAALIPASFDESDTLVDDLWQDIRGVDDLYLEGTTLIVTSARGAAVSCTAVASIVARYSSTLKAVAVNGGAQKCTVPENRMENAVSRTGSNPAAERKIRSDAATQGVTVQALSVNQGEATIYYSNFNYLHENDAVERLTRILMQDAPAGVESFRLISMEGDEPATQFELLRSSLERNEEQTGKLSILDDYSVVSSPPVQNPILEQGRRGTYPKFFWAVFPQMRQQLFDPTSPLGLQFVAGASAAVELFPNFMLQGEVEANIWNNFNVHRAPDSVLPHVRTDLLQYFTQGQNGIGDLEMNYQFKLSPDVYALARAGIFESMYAGVGGEILWRPENQRWALGADLFDVRKRAFDRLLGLQNYQVLTGHVSLYYASPWYDLNFALRAGRYLAGDTGLTFEVSRRFSTGVEIGVFVTKTNVSAAQFGEGSFDKGFMIRIPLSEIIPMFTQGEINTTIRPLQRDGGQRLGSDTLLYEATRRASLGEMSLMDLSGR